TASSITSATANTNNVCASTSVDLTANGVSAGSGATLTWFDGVGGTGNNLGTANPLTVSPATTTTYYARLDGNCNTVESSIAVTVDQTASSITSATANTNNVCASTSVDLTANGVSAGSGATLTWFDGVGGTGNNLGTTNPLTVSPAATTTYYARLDGTCNAVEESITINIIYIDTSVIVNSLSITSSEAGVDYQWLDCNNSNAIIMNETSQVFTATSNGSYSVEITKNGCVDTSSCITISTVSIEDNQLFKEAFIYPNPNQGIVNIELGTLKNVSVKVFNMNGQLVYNKENINTAEFQFELNENAGTYFVELSSDNEKKSYKLIIIM
ncbi:MAG: T9SS type A sorting domain-containing protein, partial [Flavobacteriales bacterium]|nr:T9SS type A sorting domain-containing protein [Flavobacteriales bacterium]